MVQINYSDNKIEKIREKMKTDPMYKDRDLKFSSEIMNCLGDAYLQIDRDKALIKGAVSETILELIAKGLLPEVPKI